MKTTVSGDVTHLLLAWGRGNKQALQDLTPLVYRELYRLARHYMTAERSDHSLQATALVNEAFLKLVHVNRVQWKNRAQFFGVSAQLMRRILVDFARKHRNLKRGGGFTKDILDTAVMVRPSERSKDWVALDDALNALASVDPRKARVVELRFFGGLSVDETAEVLSVSPDTVVRDFKMAKAWLYRELRKEARSDA